MIETRSGQLSGHMIPLFSPALPATKEDAVQTGPPKARKASNACILEIASLTFTLGGFFGAPERHPLR